jgi:hypothetical protein
LNRQYWRLELGRLPHSENEFRALALVLRGVDEVLRGETPTDPDFIEYVLGSRAVAEARLRLAPVGSAQ